MKQFRNNFAQAAGALDPVKQGLFCLLGAERLRTCCWAYQAAGMGDLTLGLDTLSKAFTWINPDLHLRRQQVQRVYGSLEDAVPRGGGYLAVQAQGGMVALLAGLDLLACLGQATPVDASNLIVDAVDNFQAFAAQRITGIEREPPERSELLNRELDAQLRDIAFLANWDAYDLDKLVDYRLNPWPPAPSERLCRA